MKNFYTLKNYLTPLAIALSLGLSAQTAEFTDFELTYSQNFDGLNNTLNQNDLEWTNGTTPLLGWYGFIKMETETPEAAIKYSTGCDNDGAGGLDFPGANVPNSLGYDADANTIATDRALGYRVNVSSGDAAFMLNITNNSSLSINQLEVTYSGEQWAAVALNEQKLYFSYKVDATTPEESTGFTAVSALDFTSLQIGTTGTATNRINGNDPANKTVGITATFPVSLPVGSTITLRWYKGFPEEGSDHILAIDDLTVVATPGSLSTNNIEQNAVKSYVQSDILNISSKTELTTASIYSITGSLIKQQNLNSTSAKISVSELENGIYIVKLATVNGDVIAKKFIK